SCRRRRRRRASERFRQRRSIPSRSSYGLLAMRWAVSPGRTNEALNSVAGPVLVPPKQRAIVGEGGAAEECVDLIAPGPRAVIRDRLADDVNQKDLCTIRRRIITGRCRQPVV